MSSTVYIETTIPSAFVSTRSDISSQHRKKETHNWWQRQRPLYEVLTSEAVLFELQQGMWPGQQEAILMTEPLPRVAINDEVLLLANRLIDEKLVPVELSGDAIHLAASCVYRTNYLLAWNIRHLANPRKAEHLRIIGQRLGISAPIIVMPEMLWLE